MGSPHSVVWIDVDYLSTEILDKHLFSWDNAVDNKYPVKPQSGFQLVLNYTTSTVRRRFSGEKTTPTATSESHLNIFPAFENEIEHELIPWSLIGTMVFEIGCFLTYYLTVCKYARYPSWYWIPMISFCGCWMPESIIWKSTFIIAGCFQFIAQMTLSNTFLYKKFLINSPEILRTLSYFLLSIHSFASITVGIFSLTPDQANKTVLNINNQTEINQFIDTTAVLHYVSAVGAGGCGVLGVLCSMMCYHYAFKSVGSSLPSTAIETLKWFYIFKIFCIVIMLSGLFGFVVICIWTQITGSMTINSLNFLSLCEWLLCIPMGLYDGCISLENYFIVESINQFGRSD